MTKTYGLVGSGRLSTQFQAYFTARNIPYRVWNRRQTPPPPDCLQGCDTVLVLISDQAIEAWIKEWAPHFPASTQWVHASGSLTTPLAWGCHPLGAFPTQALDPAEFESFHFVLDEGAPPFSELLGDLPNPHHRVPASLRALYHAYCVMAGNFSTLLWQEAFRGFHRELNLPGEMLIPYLKRVFENFKSNPETALTGPLVRRDYKTLHADWKALEGNKNAQTLFHAFVKTYAPETPLS